MGYHVNDTLAPLSGTCTSSTGPVDGTAVGTVSAVHVGRADGTVINRTVTVSSVGAWSLALIAGDLTVPGNYAVEVQVTFPGGTVQTFGPQSFYVDPEIA